MNFNELEKINEQISYLFTIKDQMDTLCSHINPYTGRIEEGFKDEAIKIVRRHTHFDDSE